MRAETAVQRKGERQKCNRYFSSYSTVFESRYLLEISNSEEKQHCCSPQHNEVAECDTGGQPKKCALFKENNYKQ